MKKKIVFVVGSVFVFCFILNSLFQNKEIKDIDKVDYVENLENYAYEYESPYDVGYEEGKRAVYSQLVILGKIEEKDIPREEFKKYTSLVQNEISEEDQNDLEKGYVDGYHKTLENFYCPAGGRY